MILAVAVVATLGTVAAVTWWACAALHAWHRRPRDRRRRLPPLWIRLAVGSLLMIRGAAVDLATLTRDSTR